MKTLRFMIGALIALSVVLISCEKQDASIAPEADTPTLKAKMPKVKICHLDDLGNWITIEINQNAWPAHQAHGDMLYQEFPAVGSYLWTYTHMTGVDYVHMMNITSVGNGQFEGTGYYPAASANPSVIWTMSGTYDETGWATFTIVYQSGYTVNAAGGFECGTGISGTATVGNGYGTWTLQGTVN